MSSKKKKQIVLRIKLDHVLHNADIVQILRTRHRINKAENAVYLHKTPTFHQMTKQKTVHGMIKTFLKLPSAQVPYTEHMHIDGEARKIKLRTEVHMKKIKLVVVTVYQESSGLPAQPQTTQKSSHKEVKPKIIVHSEVELTNHPEVLTAIIRGQINNDFRKERKEEAEILKLLR